MAKPPRCVFTLDWARVTTDSPLPLRPLPDAAAERRDDAFAFVTEVAGAPMAWVDPRRRRLTAANAAFGALLGYRAEALVDLPIEAFADVFPRALEGRVLVTTGHDGRLSWETRWRRRDGRAVEVTAHALEVGHGESAELLVVAHERPFDRRQWLTAEAARGLPSGVVTGVVWLDEQARVQWADDAAGLLLGRTPSALVQCVASSLWPELDAETWRGQWQVASETGGCSLELTCNRADGADFTTDLHGRLIDFEGTPLLCLFLADASPREQARRQFLDAEERYALAAMAANDGLWDWSVPDETVAYSVRWAELLGLSEQDLAPSPRTWLDRVHPDDRMRVDSELAAHFEGVSPHFESEHRLQHQDGSYRWVLARGLGVRDARGEVVRVAGSTADITHRKNAEARLRYEAFHDALTGLANRTEFIRHVQLALENAHAQRADGGFAVVFVDLDDFKLVNDSLGHTLGDMLLRAIASRLKRCVRSVDTVARLGGDEFCLLLEHVTDPSDVVRVADRVHDELGAPFNLRGYEIFTTASLGLAYGRRDYQEAEELLRDANIAMYRAKEGGRGRRAIFDASMRRAAVNRLTLETDLRRAVERGEFLVYYQPVISLETGRPTGFEALLRWKHPKRGIVGPMDFIPLAEETGLIVPLGRWVLVAACEEAMRWSALGLGPLRVSVNVSARQLALPFLVDQVSQVLDQTGLPAERLNLEITETVLMDQAETVVAKLRELRRLGVGLHIDDFGTGYSSLAYLHRFPCDTLKIDKSFLLAHPAPDEDPWAIVGTIHKLAKMLGMSVTAEGVERPEHLVRLREIGCDHAQGYLMARPLPAEQISEFLAGQPRW